MSRNLTTMTRLVLSQGHVIEDSNPTPIPFRNPVPTPSQDAPAPPIYEPPLETLQE
jgi:hypothetical protein